MELHSVSVQSIVVAEPIAVLFVEPVSVCCSSLVVRSKCRELLKELCFLLADSKMFRELRQCPFRVQVLHLVLYRE